MCRQYFIDYACGCAEQRPFGYETCMSLHTANKFEVPMGTDLRSMLLCNCFLSMGLGVTRERVERMCPFCSQGLIPGPMVLRPIGQMWEPTSEERWLNEMAWLRNQTILNEESSVIERQRLSEDRRWQEEAMAARDARGERRVWMDVVMGPGVSEEGTPDTPSSQDDTDEWSVSTAVLEGLSEVENTDEWSISTDVLDAAVEPESSEEGTWSAWSVTSSELAQAAQEQAKEDAEIEARMAQEDRELSEELMIRLAKADDKFNSLIETTIYNGYLHFRCNKVVLEKYRMERHRSDTMAGGAMPASRRENSVMEAGMDNTEVRNKEVVEAPIYGGAGKVSFNTAGEDDQSLPVAGDMPTASAILNADKPGAMDGDTVPISKKLVPIHRREKIVSGTESAYFDQDVADACKEGVEHLREGGKIYLAIKAAMGDGCVGTYQFVTDEVAHYITAFVLSTVVETLYPSVGEIKALREEKSIAAVEAVAEAALAHLAAKQAATKLVTGSWAEDSSKALATVRSGDAGTQEISQAAEGATGSASESAAENSAGVLNDAESPLPSTLEKALDPDAPRLSNRGKARGRPRGRGRAREKISSRPQVAESADASGAGGFTERSKNAETPMLPAVDNPFGLEGSGGRRSARRIRGGSDTQGFAESSKRPETRMLPPIPDKSLMVDSSQLGRMNRKIAPKPTGHQQTIGGAAGGYAQTPVLPTFDESLMVDNSRIGTGNRRTTGSHQQPIEGFAGDYAGAPMPPRLDKSLVTDNSQLGKRKRESESAPKVIGSHQQATESTVEGYAEGAENFQRGILSTLGTPFQLDDTKLLEARRGRGRGTKRARGN